MKMKMFKTLSAIVVVLGLMVMASVKVEAAQLQGAKMQLTNPVVNTETTHTFSWTTTSTNDLAMIRMMYCTTPSTALDSCVVPTGVVSDEGDETLGTLAGISSSTWTLNNTSANGDLRIENTTGVDADVTGVVSIPVTNVNNPSNLTACGGGATCYVRIRTCADVNAATCITGNTGNLVDETVVTFTVVSNVVVSAKVDPTFTFVVTGVASGAVNNAITTSAASTATTLPFGNLTAGTPRYVAHQLNVTTNTENGYTVTALMTTQMTGVYSNNNIDSFSAPWGTPAVWAEPSATTPNTNTAWIGLNTTDAQVSGWTDQVAADEKFGAIEIAATGGNIVMSEPDSDNGGAAVYLTYALEANVYQPADSYTGTLVYNALPTY